jgi:hypothetical protein
VTLEFLHCSGIVPLEWELARTPICNPQQSQISFRNGIQLIAQSDRLNFIQPYNPQSKDNSEIVQIVQRYIHALPQAGYQSISYFMRGFVFASDPTSNEVEKYIQRTLITPGAWQEIGNQPMQAGLNFVYSLDRKQLYLSLNQVLVHRVADNAPISGLIFSGQFDYPPISEIAEIEATLPQWQADITTFQDTVNNAFLQQALSPAISFPQTAFGPTSVDQPELVSLVS